MQAYLGEESAVAILNWSPYTKYVVPSRRAYTVWLRRLRQVSVEGYSVTILILSFADRLMTRYREVTDLIEDIFLFI